MIFTWSDLLQVAFLVIGSVVALIIVMIIIMLISIHKTGGDLNRAEGWYKKDKK